MLPSLHAESAAGVLGQVGGIQDVLATLRSFPASSEIASNCIAALWNLSVIGESPTEPCINCFKCATEIGLPSTMEGYGQEYLPPGVTTEELVIGGL